jgi:hypothetical protein
MKCESVSREKSEVFGDGKMKEAKDCFGHCRNNLNGVCISAFLLSDRQLRRT